MPAPLLVPYTAPGKRMVANGASRFYAVQAFHISLIHVALGVAPTGSDFTVRVKLNGASIGTVTIAAGANTNTLPMNQNVAVGQYLTVDVTAVGSGEAGRNLVLQWYGTWS